VLLQMLSHQWKLCLFRPQILLFSRVGNGCLVSRSSDHFVMIIMRWAFEEWMNGLNGQS
jgi:hypothetical protein